MKKALSFIIFIIFASGLSIQSQNLSQEQPEEQQKKETEQAEPVASLAATKKLLQSLQDQLTFFQRQNSEQSERLAGVFANWKRAGKIKQAEQWNQVRNGMNALLSIIQTILNHHERLQKLRHNKEVYDALRQLDQDAHKITPERGDTRYLMQSASLYGRQIFEKKLLEELQKVTAVTAPKEEKQPESFETKMPIDFEGLNFDEFDLKYEPDNFDDLGVDIGDDFGFDFNEEEFYF